MTSDRVKCVEFHPTEPLLAAALINGTVVICNTSDMSVVRTIQVAAAKPIRSVRWIPSINAVLTAGDDLTISAFDCNTGFLLASRPDAHADFIRQLAVHPSQTQFLSCSDDSTVHLYTLLSNREITLTQCSAGHEHYVMDVKFNPADGGATFATASLDCTVKVWDLGSSTARFTLTGHGAGVNCLAFFPGEARPYIASGSDDFTVKVWDYLNQSCVTTFTGHSANVTGVSFHPAVPLLFSIAEDQSLNAWNVLTFKQEASLDNEKKRGWCVDASSGLVAAGYDGGIVVLRFAPEGGGPKESG
jgi:coatomer subunit beta'